ncbi:LOW QUALITY PROTEIN: hypothetical protein PanWU01x14_343060 [Parasponia andersonii]|uniref:Uncharacterized protein n=1 Tax=Parasponia andersonii TaxID=3476 RepID=A0A2P5ADH4_PARAD|nr:LOW QUALITY PROTEIN: hypothetical protein PanWU01x14_343060 [Parasponia andersonii]
MVKQCTLTSQRQPFLHQFVCSEKMVIDKVFQIGVLLDYGVYPVNITRTIIQTTTVLAKTQGMVLKSTIKLTPLNAFAQEGTSNWCEFFMNRCSSNLAAVGLSAGFLRKQHCKKSLPSFESISGMGGESFKTLNMAAACINRQDF